MATFLDIVTDLMDTINRPMTETQVLARAKRSVNSAISLLQRHHAFRFTDALFRVTYPANTVKINLTDVCGGLLRDLVSVQLLGSPTATTGQNLPIASYTQVQMARNKYARLHERYQSEWEAITNEIGHAEYVSLTHKHIAFRSGYEMGLYPAPQNDVTLLIHAHSWLPLLVADGSTNFFLDYAYDVVFALAIKYLSFYMKEDNRLPATVEEFQTAIATLIAFDSQVHETNFTPLT